ncbi:MAG: hypothetical protein ABSG83_04725 [Roseiarcus sp.]|jgi:hypothetical protein
MSSLPKRSAEQASGARFRQILAEVRRTDAADPAQALDPAWTRPAHPHSGRVFSIDANLRMAGGGGADWDAALAWIDEREEPGGAPAPLPELAETPEAIGRELGLCEGLSHEQLNRLRRLFMWRNHPDRHGEAHRQIATRRVAIANMLVDRAQAGLIYRRKPKN